jgi:hypothetical protein
LDPDYNDELKYKIPSFAHELRIRRQHS